MKLNLFTKGIDDILQGFNKLSSDLDILVSRYETEAYELETNLITAKNNAKKASTVAQNIRQLIAA